MSSRETGAAQTLQDSGSKEVLSAQTQLLYDNATLGVGTTAFTSTILGLFQLWTIPQSVVLFWWLYMLLVSAFRLAIAEKYRRAPQRVEEARRWRSMFVFGAGLAGIGWGGAGIFLFPVGYLANQVLLVFTLGGMMLGAATLLAPRPEAFLVFLLPTGLGPAFRLLAQGDGEHLCMGLLAATFTVTTVVTTWRIYRTIDSSIRLQVANDDLVRDLQVAKNQTEALNQVLEIRVQERTADLVLSTEQLKEEIYERKQVEQHLLRAQRALLENEKLAATARLAATMAHEINNPLAAITNLVFLLGPLQNTSEAQDYVTKLEEQIQGLSRIATQMLKFHRDHNPPTGFKLSEVLSDILDFYRHSTENRGITFEQRIETEGMIVGFKGEIAQVISNLLSNALDATSASGRISVHLYTAPPWLCEVNNRSGYCLSVADNGKGVQRQDQARIFEPFFTTKNDKGAGLGLWVCKGIINRAAGTIRVWSTCHDNHSCTCFRIFLPSEVVKPAPVRRRYEARPLARPPSPFPMSMPK